MPRRIGELSHTIFWEDLDVCQFITSHINGDSLGLN